MSTAPVRSWFKLVGVTGGAVPDDWIHEEPSLMDIMRFPKHRKPTNISNYERLIAYAVGKGKVFSAQRRAGDIRINPPFGPEGSVTHRWPHEMDVETFAYVGNLQDAPDVASVDPGFMAKYRKNFWNGSHWLITDSEYRAFEQAILDAGTGDRVALPPWLA